MKRPGNLNVLSADKPLTDPEDDRLGYASFAQHLAESLCKMAPTEGLIVAVYGPWGSGKTTLLNFVVHYLQQKPETEQPIIVFFNPWWFSGHEDLTRRFFNQLQAVLSKLKNLAKGLREQIADFAELVSETPLPYAAGGKAFAKYLRGRQKDVPELKAKLADVLRNQKKRILVIIDDIDRLTVEEIKHLFRVVKAIVDFPNVIYLLAFDKKVVIKALEEIQGVSGEDYLEKIVQVPFELPLPDKTALRRLLLERLDEVLAGTPDELFDQTYWGNVYLEGIDHFIATPRDIVRLTNTLNVTYPAVKGEVNPVDFIAIETLRVFSPEIYDVIRRDPGAFTGHTDDLRDHNLEDLKTFHNSWMEQLQEQDREPIKRLLLRIFPKLRAVWDNTYHGSDWLSTWRKQLRICSPDIFPIYFSLAVPEGGISNVEMQAILALAGDARAFGDKLIELANQKRPDGTTRLRAFLERLEDYTEKEITLDCIPSIIQALFDVGDQLLRPEDERRGLFGFGNDIRIGRIIWQLLRRLDESSRFKVLKATITDGKAIATIVGEVATLSQQHGKYGADQSRPEEERLISGEHLQELEELALEKVREAARNDSLLQVPELPRILYCWRDWAGEEEAKQWVQRAINGDEGLLTFLGKFLQKTYSQSLSDVVGKTGYRLDPRSLEPFVQLCQIIERARSLVEESELTENQRIALGQFVREYEMRQQGKNPNDPFAWEDE